MTPVFNGKQITITLHCNCPDCGKQWDRTITIPQEIADVFTRLSERVLCTPCGDKRKAEENSRIIAEAELEQIEAAEIPPEFRQWDESKGNKSVVEWVTEYKYGNMLLIGEVNTGKTRSMAKVLIEELKSGKNVLFVDFNSFADDYAGAMQESMAKAKKYLQSVINGGYDIILLDDIDKHRINDTAGSLLYKIFNSLYNGDIVSKMWFTMNHRGKEFLQRFENRDYGKAVVSRISRMMEDGRFHVKHIGETQ